MDSQYTGRAIVDPSLVFSSDALDWLEQDPESQDALVVPRTFAEWIFGRVDMDPSVLLAPEDVEMWEGQRDRVRALIDRLPTFSHRDVRALPERAHEEVRRALGDEDPVARLHADEWAFLQTQSAMLSKLRRPLDAFRDAGAVIVEFGRRTGVQLVERVIPKEHLPPSLTTRIVVTATVKWVVLGGASVGGGTLGGVAGTALGGPAGTALGGKLGGFLAGGVANAALLAIDP